MKRRAPFSSLRSGSPRRSGIVVALVLATSLAGCAEKPKIEPAKPKSGDTAAKSGDAATKSAPAPAKSAAGTKRIIILTNGNSPFWDACRAGMLDAEKELGLKAAGYQAVLEVNDGSPQGQLDKLRQFGSQSDIAGVGVSALDADNIAIADEMRNLQKKGIKVVTIDSDVNRDTMRDARFAYLGTDNLVAGRELGVCAKTLVPDGGGYVTFVGRTGAQNAIERISGFAEGAGDKFKSLDSMGDDTDLTRARENVRNAIRNKAEQLKALVGIWSYNAPAIVDVVKETNTRDKYKIVTFDAEPGAVVAMGEKMIDAMIVQNPHQMGYQGVRVLRALVEDDQKTIKEMFPKHGEKDGDLFDTGLKIIVPDDSSAWDKVKFPANIEVMKLGAFKDWLRKYNLEGS